MISEKDYKKEEKTRINAWRKMEELGKKLEPYWDKNTHNIKGDAPDSIKREYKLFLEMFDKLSNKV